VLFKNMIEGFHILYYQNDMKKFVSSGHDIMKANGIAITLWQVLTPFPILLCVNYNEIPLSSITYVSKFSPPPLQCTHLHITN
jgi:hypothetical protein